MTTLEIQNYILTHSGLKTSVKSFKNGSMKGYFRIMPIYQNGNYPNIPENVWKELKTMLKSFDYAEKPLFCGYSEICVYGIENNCITMKRESKPKEIKDLKVRSWGSKNSQMRLDKVCRRAAKIPLWQRQ
jgi:hypothetical protein